jgi:uncharacterized protein (TIGR02147 family)
MQLKAGILELTRDTEKKKEGVSDKAVIAAPITVPQNAPYIFDYLNYREFLRDYYNFNKSKHAGFSYGSFANKGKFQTRNYLKRVIDGERTVLAENFPKFFKALSFTPKEAQYFETLVNYNQSKDADSKKYYFHMLKEAASGIKNSAVEISAHQFEIFSTWYVIPVFESLSLTHIDHTPDAISKVFRKKISAKDVKHALDLLSKSGIVALDPESNRYKKTNEEIRYTQGDVNFAIREFHKQTLSNAIEFIDSENIESRYLRSLTLAINAKHVDEVYQEIDKLVKALNSKYSNVKNEKEVLMQFNLNILNLVK